MSRRGFLLSYAFCFLLSSCESSVGQQLMRSTKQSHDSCVERILRERFENLTESFGRYKRFVESMYPSRRLYGQLFAGNFSSEDLVGFCEVHKTARSKIDECPATAFRKMVSHGFGLADYVCTIRIKDFSEAIECLQTHYRSANETCRDNCTQNEERSAGYTFTTANHVITNILPFYMAGDCSYLKCMANCRRPLLRAKCGARRGSLDMDALYATFASSWEIYEPIEIRRLLPRGFRSVYPNECRALGEAAACDTGYDSTAATSASTSGPATETRVLIAVWTTDAIVEKLPTSCNLERRARKILCHFNSTATSTPTLCQ